MSLQFHMIASLLDKVSPKPFLVGQEIFGFLDQVLTK